MKYLRATDEFNLCILLNHYSQDERFNRDTSRINNKELTGKLSMKMVDQPPLCKKSEVSELSNEKIGLQIMSRRTVFTFS